MNRREAIAGMAILAGGMWLMKACSSDTTSASITLENYKMTKDLDYQDTSPTGVALRDSLLHPKLGHWWVGAQMMGETIPKKEHRVFLDKTEKDVWGVPLVNISVGYDENDDKMSKDFVAQFSEMYEKAGFHNIHSSRDDQPPGLDIHEMGGVRMGRDPKTSMLNEWNQLHACKNVFVTDGASMTSTSTQNLSLTYMALTARAVDFAILTLKKGDI